MKVEYINPFVNATTDVFDTMLSCPLTRGELRLSGQDQPEHDISGVIGLSGDASGLVVVSIDKQVAFQAARVMLCEPISTINADIVDLVGELANMIAGAAKAKLDDFELSVSLPTVIVGTNHVIGFPSNARPICIPFESPWGSLCLEVSLKEHEEPIANQEPAAVA
jgi:chemotaxis protein CheX